MAANVESTHRKEVNAKIQGSRLSAKGVLTS